MHVCKHKLRPSHDHPISYLIVIPACAFVVLVLVMPSYCTWEVITCAGGNDRSNRARNKAGQLSHTNDSHSSGSDNRDNTIHCTRLNSMQSQILMDQRQRPCATNV